MASRAPSVSVWLLVGKLDRMAARAGSLSLPAGGNFEL
jgi:hypothetical protein